MGTRARDGDRHLPDQVMYEKNGLADDVMTSLTAMGYSFKERGHIADAPSIGFLDGRFVGAPEPRRDGGLAAGR